MQLGLVRFKQYIFGQQVTVDTDQKPLVGLLDKPVAECSLRIQRMRLQLKSFDFLLIYKPGKKLFIADALSRAHLPIFFTDDATEGCQEQFHSLLDHIIPLQDTRHRYVQGTDEDPALKLVKELLVTGWPEKRVIVLFQIGRIGMFAILSLKLKVLCFMVKDSLFQFL